MTTVNGIWVPSHAPRRPTGVGLLDIVEVYDVADPKIALGANFEIEPAQATRYPDLLQGGLLEVAPDTVNADTAIIALIGGVPGTYTFKDGATLLGEIVVDSPDWRSIADGNENTVEVPGVTANIDVMVTGPAGFRLEIEVEFDTDAVLPGSTNLAKDFSGRFYVSSYNETLYAGVECGFREWEQFADKAATRLELGSSMALENFLWETAFRNDSTEVTASLSSVVGQMAELEQHALVDYRSAVTLHVSPLLGAILRSEDFIEGAVGGLSTVNGSKVVIGVGYSTEFPSSGKPHTALEQWAFATGEVSVFRGPAVSAQGHMPLTNRHAALAERQYAIAIDGPNLGCKITLENP